MNEITSVTILHYKYPLQYLIASLDDKDKTGISQIVKSDDLILEVCQWLLDKQVNKKEHTPATKQRVRGLGRILIQMR